MSLAVAFVALWSVPTAQTAPTWTAATNLQHLEETPTDPPGISRTISGLDAAINSSGTAVVAWSDELLSDRYATPQVGTRTLHIAVGSSRGFSEAAGFQLPALTDSVAAAINQRGKIVVAWLAGTSLYVSSREAGSSAFSEPRLLTSSEQLATPPNLKLLLTPQGKAVIIWDRLVSKKADVPSGRYRETVPISVAITSSGKVGSVAPVDATRITSSNYDLPAAKYLLAPSGDVVALWAGNVLKEIPIKVSLLRSGSTTFSDTATLQVSGVRRGSLETGNVGGCIDSNSRLRVAWAQEEVSRDGERFTSSWPAYLASGSTSGRLEAPYEFTPRSGSTEPTALTRSCSGQGGELLGWNAVPAGARLSYGGALENRDLKIAINRGKRFTSSSTICTFDNPAGSRQPPTFPITDGFTFLWSQRTDRAEIVRGSHCTASSAVPFSTTTQRGEAFSAAGNSAIAAWRNWDIHATGSTSDVFISTLSL